MIIFGTWSVKRFCRFRVKRDRLALRQNAVVSLVLMKYLILHAFDGISENLFGNIMDFSDGIPEGPERDRALASIQWIHDAFRAKLPDYLTIDQKAAVEEFGAHEAVALAGRAKLSCKRWRVFEHPP